MPTRSLLISAVLAILAGGCFGNSLQRSTDPGRMLVVNLGANRYVYSAVQYEQVPAAPTLARPARGSQPGEVAAALGGTHFAVVDATAGSDGTIRGLTAIVLLRM